MSSSTWISGGTIPSRSRRIYRVLTAGVWLSAAFTMAFFLGIPNNVYEAWDTARNDPSGEVWGNVYERAMNGAEYMFLFLCAAAILAACIVSRMLIRRKYEGSTGSERNSHDGTSHARSRRGSHAAVHEPYTHYSLPG